MSGNRKAAADSLAITWRQLAYLEEVGYVVPDLPGKRYSAERVDFIRTRILPILLIHKLMPPPLVDLLQIPPVGHIAIPPELVEVLSAQTSPKVSATTKMPMMAVPTTPTGSYTPVGQSPPVMGGFIPTISAAEIENMRLWQFVHAQRAAAAMGQAYQSYYGGYGGVPNMFPGQQHKQWSACATCGSRRVLANGCRCPACLGLGVVRGIKQACPTCQGRGFTVGKSGGIAVCSGCRGMRVVVVPG